MSLGEYLLTFLRLLRTLPSSSELSRARNILLGIQILNTLRTGLLNCLNARSRGLTLGNVRPVYRDRRFATLQRMLFIYLIKKYISLSDICLTVHH